MGSLLSIPLCRLELISFSATPGNNMFCFLDLYFCGFFGLKSHFWSSLHSKPLHGLELNSFSAIPGNKCSLIFSDTLVKRIYIFCKCKPLLPHYQAVLIFFNNIILQHTYVCIHVQWNVREPLTVGYQNDILLNFLLTADIY